MYLGEPSTKTCVSIQGTPLYSGAFLTSDSPVWNRLHTRADYTHFARGLRGQFSIVVESGEGLVAISDFGGTRPIFYVWDAGRNGFCINQEIAGLKQLADNRLNPRALFFYATESGVGIDPFYSGIKSVYPATVTFFEGARVESQSYVDWGKFLEEVPIGAEAAQERFLAIASEYFEAVLAGESRVGCLLSGGIDSSLLTWLLQSLGKEVICFNADYPWRRYSEFAAAARHAALLKLPIERVALDRATHREAFLALNSRIHNAPCSQLQSPSLYELARRARQLGITKLVTGDHADSLFLGFERFFRGLPRDSDAYRREIAEISPAHKIARVYPKPRLEPNQRELISFAGYDVEEYLGWRYKLHAADCNEMAPWAERASLPALQQVAGQIWAGVGWQNTYLPVAQAFGGQIEFISPFYDLKMIEFALSLPVEHKFRDGSTKPLLRDLLRRAMPDATIVKRASPNPARIWSLVPDFKERGLQAKRIRPLYDRLYARNLRQTGKLALEAGKIAALGLWLANHPLEF